MDFHRFLILRLASVLTFVFNRCTLSWKMVFILQDLPDVYTRVSYFLPWLNTTILSNGGLASCNFFLTALPSQGSLQSQKKTGIRITI